MEREEVIAYRNSLEEHGVIPNDGLFRFNTRNLFLSQADSPFSNTELDEEASEKLYEEVQKFRELAGSLLPFDYISKVAFVDKLSQMDELPQELLKLFLSDRTFYFSEYRDMGTLLGDGQNIEPVTDFGSLILYDDAWDIAAQTPGELLQIGREWVENIEVPNSIKEAAQSVFDTWLSPPPSFIIEPEKIQSAIVDKIQDPERKTLDLLMYGYKAAHANHMRAKQVCEREWIPSTIHKISYDEMQKNYVMLTTAIQQRQDELLSEDKIINELNDLSSKTTKSKQVKGNNVLPKHDKLLTNLVEIFETYVRSFLRKTHDEKLAAILEYQDKPFEERHYVHSIRSLLFACQEGKGLHILTPLFLYQAFAENTTAILINKGSKLVHKISRITKSAKVIDITSTTGVRAAINLVLFRKLIGVIPLAGRWKCLLGRPDVETCINTTYADSEIKKRINTEHCGDTFDPVKCPFMSTAEQLNEFGFAITTGYGHLYHHRRCSSDTLLVSCNEIHSKGKRPTKDKDAESRKYKVWEYRINFRKPVGTLEGILVDFVCNCLPNRACYLTPTSPNTYARDTQHPFFSPYEELSTLLLQDMHLEARMRISKELKATVSKHPEYLNEYRRFLIYPHYNASVIELLQAIINDRGLEHQVLKYYAYQKSGSSYNIMDILQNILEYEIRARIYESAQSDIAKLIDKTFDPELFLYKDTRVSALL